jgi:hypothetical protein
MENHELDFYNPFSMAGAVFDNMNSELCSDCQAAIAITSAQARKMGTKFSKESGCCSLCAEHNGYFSGDFYSISPELALETEKSQENRDSIEPWKNNVERTNNLKEKYGFDESYGFFDSMKHGCRLPRTERSIICSVYYCPAIGKSLTNSEKQTIESLKKRMIESRRSELGI